MPRRCFVPSLAYKLNLNAEQCWIAVLNYSSITGLDHRIVRRRRWLFHAALWYHHLNTLEARTATFLRYAIYKRKIQDDLPPTSNRGVKSEPVELTLWLGNDYREWR